MSKENQPIGTGENGFSNLEDRRLELRRDIKNVSNVYSYFIVLFISIIPGAITLTLQKASRNYYFPKHFSRS